jgi:hypothetical protein
MRAVGPRGPMRILKRGARQRDLISVAAPENLRLV